MKTARINIRIDASLLEQVRDYAKEREVTLTFLIEEFFRTLLAERLPPLFDQQDQST